MFEFVHSHALLLRFRTVHGHDVTDVANSNTTPAVTDGAYQPVGGGGGLLKSETGPVQVGEYSAGLQQSANYPSIMRLPSRPPSGPTYSYPTGGGTAGGPGTNSHSSTPVSEYNNNNNGSNNQMSPHPTTPNYPHNALSPNQQNSPGQQQQQQQTPNAPTYTQLAPSTAPSRGEFLDKSIFIFIMAVLISVTVCRSLDPLIDGCTLFFWHALNSFGERVLALARVLQYFFFLFPRGRLLSRL